MLLQSVAGLRLPTTRQMSGQPDVPGGLLAELLCSGVNPQYYHLVKNGRVFHYAVTFSAIAGFAGLSPNSMQLGMLNPADSGVDAILLQARVGIQNLGTPGSGQMAFGYFGGNLNYNAGGGPSNSASMMAAYGNAHAGSQVISYTSTGLPNDLTFLGTLMTTGRFTQAGPPTPGLYVDQVAGAQVCPPGNALALGNVSSTDSVPNGPIVLSWTWAEIPI